MKLFLLHFFSSLLFTNCLALGALIAGAQPSYWTEFLCVGFSLAFAVIMVFEPRIKL